MPDMHEYRNKEYPIQETPVEYDTSSGTPSIVIGDKSYPFTTVKLTVLDLDGVQKTASVFIWSDEAQKWLGKGKDTNPDFLKRGLFYLIPVIITKNIPWVEEW